MSLRNVKKTIAATEETGKDEDANALNIDPKKNVVQVLNLYSKEPALADLHQFISNSGLFNLDQLKPEML